MEDGGRGGAQQLRAKSLRVLTEKRTRRISILGVVPQIAGSAREVVDISCVRARASKSHCAHTNKPGSLSLRPCSKYPVWAW